jgi:hypothetical protein
MCALETNSVSISLCQRTGPGLWVTYLSRATVGNPGSMQALYRLAALYLDGLCVAYGHIKRGGIFSSERSSSMDQVRWLLSYIYTCNESTGCLLAFQSRGTRLKSRAWDIYVGDKV